MVQTTSKKIVRPSEKKPRACVPHTPYTLILRFASPAGRVCGVATHAVGGNAGYGLLLLSRVNFLELLSRDDNSSVHLFLFMNISFISL